MHDILVLYYSHRGSVRALAERIARGIESVPGAQARLREQEAQQNFHIAVATIEGLVGNPFALARESAR